MHTLAQCGAWKRNEQSGPISARVTCRQTKGFISLIRSGALGWGVMPSRYPAFRECRSWSDNKHSNEGRRGIVVNERHSLTAELASTLERVAREQSLSTYADLAAAIRSVQLEPQSPELARLLCERIVADVEADRPLLSCLVVGRRTNRPGRGFFSFARRYFRIEDDDEFWLAEVAACHDYYRRSRLRRRGVGTPVRQPVAAASSPNSDRAADISNKDFILSFFE